MIVIAIFIVCTMVARPFIDKFRGIVQVFMLGIFDIFIFGLCIVYLQFENYDGWAVGVCAIVVRVLPSPFLTCSVLHIVFVELCSS